MSELILQVRDVAKSFEMRESFQYNLKEALARVFSSNHVSSFTALQNISFELGRGEVLGIIGKNGAGKSTLLRILSGITLPDAGEINFYGKAVSILEIGAGFHPDLTGRENVFLVGELYGLNKAVIREKMETIAALSGIGKFIDEPVKNYSSGMYVRLAFATVTNLDADLMIFDEVLGVGDADFQMTIMERIKQMLNEKRSIIIVTHNPRDIVNLCDKVIEIEGGKIIRQGGTEVLAQYLGDTVNTHVSLSGAYNENKFVNSESGKALSQIAISQPGEEKIYADKEITIQIEADNAEGAALSFGISIADMQGNALISSGSDMYKESAQQAPGGKFNITCAIPADFFSNGNYLLSVFVVKDKTEMVERYKNVLRFTVEKNRRFYDTPLFNRAEIPIIIPFSWKYGN